MEENEELSAPDAARLRFNRLQGLLMALFALTILGAVLLVRAVDGPVARTLAAAVPAAVLVAWAVAFARMIRGEDEMMHLVQLRAVAVGGGLVLFVASLWGLFESMLGAPRLPSFLLLPAFALVYGIVVSMQEGPER